MPLSLESKPDDLLRLENALIVPPLSGKSVRVQPSGVLDENFNFVEQSISWSSSTDAVNSAPALSNQSQDHEKLDGRYLFGGIFYGHFGHFIVESLSRIWALDALDGTLNGMIFTPKGPRISQKHIDAYRDLLSALGAGVPILIAHDATRVSELYVPRQGFGMYDLIEGSPAFRNFINKHAGKNIEAEGPEKLYISRSMLGPNRGSILNERMLEEYLAAEGYEIFHPQKASQNEQIARYKAARKIIATDCSPLHLVGYVGDSGQQIGVITRRSMDIGSYLVKQLRTFKNSDAREFNCLVNDWAPELSKRPSRSSWGEVDFTRLHIELLAAGLIEGRSPWPNQSREERSSELQQIEKIHEISFKPLQPAD